MVAESSSTLCEGCLGTFVLRYSSDNTSYLVSFFFRTSRINNILIQIACFLNLLNDKKETQSKLVYFCTWLVNKTFLSTELEIFAKKQ